MPDAAPATQPLRSRQQRIFTLAAGAWDLVVIGGGASGLGTALDAALRGLKVALIEADDYAAGTSSISTKLVHGGVRYLEKAARELDFGQYHLVREALRERQLMLANAPHLAWPLPTMLPVSGAWQRFYFGIGLWLYDRVAGRGVLRATQWVSPQKLRQQYANLHPQWRGAWAYTDGQFDDARYALALALSAQNAGALVMNHCRATGFVRDNGRIQSVEAQDTLTGQTLQINCRAVVNATGPFADRVRQWARPNAAPRLRPSKGIHLVLPRAFWPHSEGLLVPKTRDGRVLFVLPWEGQLLVGTTDTDAPNPFAPPRVTPEDRQSVLAELPQYLTHAPTEADILAEWAGYRPLVASDKPRRTEALIRNHELEIWQPEGILSLLGGKWTTYRQMAEETVDAVLRMLGQPARPCSTRQHRLWGAPAQAPAPAQHQPPANYLARYGTEADTVRQWKATFGDQPLVAGLPHTLGELHYVVCQTDACTADDVLLRRLRLGMVNQAEAEQLRPFVVQVLAEYGFAAAESEVTVR